MNEAQVIGMKKELQLVRLESMKATRAGDFMKVARMTARAAKLNQEIMEAEGLMDADRTGANPRHAKRR